MPRDANPIKSELITLSLNVQTLWYLDRLVETGLFGNNRSEAARVALYDHCKLLIAQDQLAAAPILREAELSGRNAPAPARRR
jgi:Arc/MetJ-type ribon-helix-helix transcriptional regulator